MAVRFLQYKSGGHVSCETVTEFQKAILESADWLPVNEAPAFVWKSLGKITSALPFLRGLGTIFRIKGKSLFILMGVDSFRRTYPFSLMEAEAKCVYFFDAWENKFAEVERFIRQHNIGIAFFSSKQASAHFLRRMPEIKSCWIPEGIAEGVYRYVPYEKKDIDVLQLGRKYDHYHDGIVDHCTRNKITYKYEVKKGNVIFPAKDDFIRGLARTRISICFSSDITHPERSGCISTMTQRYLQSMLSKCLVLGNTPDEMRDLFGYEPVIAADLKDPMGQLDSLLKNFHDFIPLIERNYGEVLRKHAWKCRIAEMQSILASR